ncbi:hypothetical protein BSG1_01025, partial [Bacillus sp. SG-1]
RLNWMKGFIFVFWKDWLNHRQQNQPLLFVYSA